MKIPFVIYADFESFLKPIQTCDNNNTHPFTYNVQKHEAYSFGYYIKCSFDDNLSKYKTYSGSNCAQVFMKRLNEDLKVICRKNSFQTIPKKLSSTDSNKVANAKTCYICETDWNEEKVLGFDWQTGNFGGVAHEVCEKKIRVPHHIPVFFIIWVATMRISLCMH